MLVTACTRDLDKFGAKSFASANDGNKIDFTIPIEEAIEELNSALDVIDGQQMAAGGRAKVMFSGSRRQIGKVSVIYGDMPVLMRTSNTPDGMQKAQGKTHKDSLLYIVDFENNAGCAVLAADRRIKDKILAIIESGSFNNMDSTMFPPTYKQGMYADSELMKGFSLYNADVDDYYVAGEFSPLYFCDNFAKYCLTQCDDPDPSTIPPSDPHESIKYVVGEWQTKEKIAPMLTTVWHQNSPFNDNAPMLNWAFWQKWKKRSPAGCFPIAIAQIIAYHEMMSECNGYKLNWKSIKKNLYVNNKPDEEGASYEDKRAVAYLLQFLSISCRAKHTPDFTFVFPHNARKTMEFVYGNAATHCSYDNGVVYNMLKNKKPALVCAISKIVDGHAWVVDGYLHRAQPVICIRNCDGKERRDTTYRDQYLVHCNWGWKGLCNGYYSQGIFNLKNGAVAVEKNNGESENDKSNNNFNWFLRVISYAD
jgi:putative pyrogenic exotoxin B